jgi:hypothetical protein
MTGIVSDIVREAFRRNRLLATTAAVNLALFLLLLPLSLFDSMEVLGINRWIKPMKFAISIAAFLGTMAWLLYYLRESSPRAVRAISRTMAVTMAGEMVVIVMQAVRGVPSHFNQTSVFNGIAFSTMGVLIVLNTLAAMYALYLFYRRPVALPRAYLTGIRLGMVVFVLASLEGGLMVARNSHSVGLHDGGPGLPFVNWSTRGGDLRVAHFVGMHALQVLPLFGWLLTLRAVPRGERWVRVVAAAWLVLAGVLVAQALAGRPLLAFAQ